MKNKYEVQGDITVIYMRRRSGEVIETIISTKDLPKAQSFAGTWHPYLNKSNNSFYARISVNRKNIMLHRHLMDTPEGHVTDHRNLDTLDNTRDNLRNITQAQNLQNKKKYSNNLSGERGVQWVSARKKWRVRVMHNGAEHYGGLFEDKEEAIQVAKQLRADILPYSTN